VAAWRGVHGCWLPQRLRGQLNLTLIFALRLEYPRDYKLLNVGGTASSFAALSSGQIAAAMQAVPNAFQAQEAGFNVIGRIADVFPNHLLSAYSVKRSWAEKNRPQVVRFLKAVLRAKKWFEEDRRAAVEYLAKEFQLKPSLAEQGLDYYLTHQAWHPELEIEMDGLKTVVEIYAEQTGMKGGIPSAEKYVDSSYLKQALKELCLEIMSSFKHTDSVVGLC
jgi:NitT/TauT family transport system substrate-binding protein